MIKFILYGMLALALTLKAITLLGYQIGPRTHFNGSQFTCKCGWVSQFDAEFIAEYKLKWGL